MVELMAEWTVVHWVVMSECNLVEMKDATKVEMSVDRMVGLRVVHWAGERVVVLVEMTVAQ